MFVPFCPRNTHLISNVPEDPRSYLKSSFLGWTCKKLFSLGYFF